MIVEGIQYTRQVADRVCSTSACIHMLAGFYGVALKPDEIYDGFWKLMMSGEFNNLMLFSHDAISTDSVTLYCAARYMSDVLRVNAEVFSIETSKIYLTYIKRRIPVIVSGRFPVIGGKVQNTVLIKGYVGQFAIVNDPKGNAITHYTERMGENVLYNTSVLEQWVGKTTDVVRVIT